MGDDDAALSHYAEAVRVEARTIALYHYNHGVALMRAGRHMRGGARVSKHRTPTSTQLRGCAVRSRDGSGPAEPPHAALAHYEEALRSKPDEAEYRITLRRRAPAGETSGGSTGRIPACAGATSRTQSKPCSARQMRSPRSDAPAKPCRSIEPCCGGPRPTPARTSSWGTRYSTSTACRLRWSTTPRP